MKSWFEFCTFKRDRPLSISEIKSLLSSPDPEQRLEGLFEMRFQSSRGSPHEFISLAESLIADPDNHCRWQALIVVGEFIKTDPQSVWAITRKYGQSPDEDMRDGVATILLEHLLEYHFDDYLPLLENEVRAGATLLRDTLERCWPFGDAEAKWHRVQELLGKTPR